MARLALLVVAAMLVSLACGATLKHHSLTVYEKGVLFKQKIDIDVENQIIHIHVPGHRNIPDSRYMYEYSTGRVLRCVPSIKQCFLSNFDTKSLPDPPEEEIDLQTFARRHISPKMEARMERKVKEDMAITEKINNLHTISKLMRQAVGNFALYREEPLPKDAEILKGTLNPKPAKQKRNNVLFINVARCPDGKDPVRRYAKTMYYCNRMVLCSEPRGRGTCVTRHLYGGEYFACGCCRDEWSPDQCRYHCSNMNTGLFTETFNKLGWRKKGLNK